METKNLSATINQFALYQGKRFGQPINTIQYNLEFKKESNNLIEFENGFSITKEKYKKLLNGETLELSPIPNYSTTIKLN